MSYPASQAELLSCILDEDGSTVHTFLGELQGEGISLPHQVPFRSLNISAGLFQVAYINYFMCVCIITCLSLQEGFKAPCAFLKSQPTLEVHVCVGGGGGVTPPWQEPAPAQSITF